MKKIRSCVVCGEPTAGLLFKDKMLSIPMCSRKCEYEYFRKLSPDMKERMNIVRYLDEKMEEIKKRDKIGWSVSGSALIAIVIALVLASVTLFLAGAVIVTLTTLVTRYFEDQINKLAKMRRRILI